MDFLAEYLILAVIVGIAVLLFWGAVIYFIVRFFRSDSSLSTHYRVGTGDLMDTEAGSLAASQGIDLNDNR